MAWSTSWAVQRRKSELLPQVASAELQLAVALDEPQSHYQLHDVQTRAEAVNGGWNLNGRKSVMVGGQSAGLILVSARTAGGIVTKAASACFCSTRERRV